MEAITTIQKVYSIAPLIIAAGITALAGLGVAAYNRNQTKKQNERDEQNARDREARQRQYDLEDWNRANQYNAPDQQMTRLRQAGLNPNLIYGKGADNTAQSIRGGAAQPPVKQTTPTLDIDPQNMIAQFQGVKNIKAQTDNLNADIQLKQKEELVKDANIAKTMQDTATSKFELEKAKELKDQIITKAKLENESLRTNIDLSLNKNQMEQAKNNAEVPKIIQDTVNAQLQNKLMQLQYTTNVQEQRKREEEIKQLQILQEGSKKDNEIKQLDINLKKNGIQPGDPMYMRMISQLLGQTKTEEYPTPKYFVPKSQGILDSFIKQSTIKAKTKYKW